MKSVTGLKRRLVELSRSSLADRQPNGEPARSSLVRSGPDGCEASGEVRTQKQVSRTIGKDDNKFGMFEQKVQHPGHSASAMTDIVITSRLHAVCASVRRRRTVSHSECLRES